MKIAQIKIECQNNSTKDNCSIVNINENIVTSEMASMSLNSIENKLSDDNNMEEFRSEYLIQDEFHHNDESENIIATNISNTIVGYNMPSDLVLSQFEDSLCKSIIDPIIMSSSEELGS